MANLLDQVGAGISGFTWESLGWILLVFGVFIFLILVFAAVFLFMWYNSFNLRVKIYEPRGQVQMTQEDINKIYSEVAQGKSDTLKQKGIKFDLINIKKTKGKHLTQKGTPYFQTFIPLRKMQPVPMELMFNDGIHLLRLSREIFVPIPKPETDINVGGNVSISVTDHNQWTGWSQMMAEKINSKYTDVDTQKRAMMYFVIGIAAMVIVGGIILWLIYLSAKKGLDAADKLGAVADSLVQGQKPA